MDNPTTTAKVCTKCGETKPLGEFGKRRTSADGLQYACKPCLNANNRGRYATFRVPQAEETVALCRHCGARLSGGRRSVREFCSRACYHEWDRLRIEAEAATIVAKRCTSCGATKPLDEFNNDRKGKAGRSAACKMCHSAAGRNYATEHQGQIRAYRAQRYAGQRDEALARAAAYQRANPERVKEAKRRSYEAKREEYLAKNKANREANRDRINAERAAKNRQNPEPARQRARAWYNANRERARAQARKWKRKNPEKRLESQRERRAKKKGAPIIKLTAAQWALILDYFGHACAYCGVTGVSLTQDHVVPLSRGGEHSAANVVPACVHCNSRKFARPLWRFLMERGHEHGTHG